MPAVPHTTSCLVISGNWKTATTAAAAVITTVMLDRTLQASDSAHQPLTTVGHVHWQPAKTTVPITCHTGCIRVHSGLPVEDDVRACRIETIMT